ncbi:MAG: hypothetical protein OEO23_04770, partial [Gemmatimonadota bacterium]|nr:hypothetical protein [Gemmatimonadota bacterium]
RGTVSLVFRRWKRPTVRSGGTLNTALGVLDVLDVETVDLDAITLADAKAAGFRDLESLWASMPPRVDAAVYRIRVRYRGADPRIALRERIPGGEEMVGVLEALRRRARRSGEPAPQRLLRLIADRPATLAATLADQVGLDRGDLKRRVRGLKALGLTESLPVGYRLSPRGKAVLEALERDL